MLTRYLTAIFLAMLLTVAAHAQTANEFPALPNVPGTPQLTDDPKSTHFTFIAAGDNRPASHGAKQPETLSQILKDSTRFKPSFMLWSGDTIAGFRVVGHKMDTDGLTKQYEEFFGIVAKAKVPIFNSPGNHEMDSLDKTDNNVTIETPDEKMEELYLKMMKYPPNAAPYGAFNYGNSRFIAVDTEEVPRMLTLRSPGKVANNVNLDPGFVSPAQLKLLATDLEANKHKAHIFVFMHHPIRPAKSGSRLNKENADDLEKLFAQYPNVSFAIAAHEHLYYNASGNTLNPAPRTNPAKGGPVYLVSGGAGAPLDSCPSSSSKNCVAAFHYLVFEVNGNTATVKVVVVTPSIKTKAD